MTYEGMRRLGIVFGVLAAFCWGVLIAFASDGFKIMSLRAWVIFLLGFPASFGITYLMAWVIDWIVAGFRTGSKR